MRSTDPPEHPSIPLAPIVTATARDFAAHPAASFVPGLVDRRTGDGSRVLVIPTSTAASPAGASRGPVAIELWILGGTSAEGDAEHGCAHLLEHMLFKPTPAPAGSGPDVDIASAIESLGGDVNAFTSHDETVFHATVPAATVPEALPALITPIVKPRFDPDELRRELSVVVEEIKQYDDDPASSVYQDLMDMLYRGHSYARPVLGRAAEVRRHDVAGIRAFHRSVYTAQRTVLVVVGPVDPDETLALAEPLLCRLPRRGRTLPKESVLDPLRPRVRVRCGNVGEAQLTLGWLAPKVPNPDACALEIASVVLGYGDASRLDAHTRRGSKLVTEAQANFYVSRQRSSFVISANTPAGRLDKATDAVLQQLERLRRIPIDEEELRRARAVLQSDLVYRRETVQGLAHAVGNQLSLWGDLAGERRYFEALEAVRPDSVRDACQRLLDPAHACLAAVIPKSGAGPRRAAALRTSLARRLRSAGTRRAAVSPRTKKGIVCAELGSGLRIRVIADPTVPIAAGWLVWPGGLRHEAARDSGASALTAELLTRGCDAIEGDDLAREIDGSAAVLEGFSGRNTTGLHFECLAPQLEHVLRRTLECAVAPTFPADEVEEERRVALEDLDAEEDDLAGLAFREALAGLYRGHPFGRRRRGTPASLQRLTPRRLAKLWHDGYPTSRATLGVCGDVDVNAVVRLCEALDVERQAGGVVARPGGVPKYPRRSATRILPCAREQAHFVAAWPGLVVQDPRVYALDVLIAVLGGQAGRLFEALRERNGLVYSVSASSAEGVDAGHVSIYGATSPSNLEVALGEVQRQVERIVTDGVTHEELDRARAWVIGQHEVEMQRRSRIATQLAFDEALGLPIGDFREFPRRVGRVSARAVADLSRELFALPRVTAIVGAT